MQRATAAKNATWRKKALGADPDHRPSALSALRRPHTRQALTVGAN
jgi:hypothetical protein